MAPQQAEMLCGTSEHSAFLIQRLLDGGYLTHDPPHKDSLTKRIVQKGVYKDTPAGIRCECGTI